MVQKIDNFLSLSEAKWFIEWYKNNLDKLFNETNEYVENYEGIEIDKSDLTFPLFKKISPEVMENLRIQKTDINVTPIQIPHTHKTPYNFVIFLNEEFHGGHLIFESGEIFKPKTGTMILFEGEGHYPTPVTDGERWVFACFLNSRFNTNKTLL
jgi:hypothetical protein